MIFALTGQMAINVFIVHTSDEPLVKKLGEHLSILEKQAGLCILNERRVDLGIMRNKALQEQLTEAEIILLLISATFLNTERNEKALEMSLERCTKDGTHVIPVLLRPFDLSAIPQLAELPCLPRNGKPVSLWTDVDEACAEIAKEVSRVAKNIREKRQALLAAASRPVVPVRPPTHQKPPPLPEPRTIGIASLVALSVVGLFWLLHWLQTPNKTDAQTKSHELTDAGPRIAEKPPREIECSPSIARDSDDYKLCERIASALKQKNYAAQCARTNLIWTEDLSSFENTLRFLVDREQAIWQMGNKPHKCFRSTNKETGIDPISVSDLELSASSYRVVILFPPP